MYRLLQYIEVQPYFTLPRFGGFSARFVDQKTIEIHGGTPQNLPHAYAIFHKHVFVIFFCNISQHKYFPACFCFVLCQKHFFIMPFLAYLLIFRFFAHTKNVFSGVEWRLRRRAATGDGHAGHTTVGPSWCGDAGPGTECLLCRGCARRRARVPHACSA